jgi:branched-chain amino acid transport system ATP-binding protein
LTIKNPFFIVTELAEESGIKREVEFLLSGETIIDVENVSLAFGGVQALYNVSTHLLPGEIFAIIGPNGAGKTCLLNCISRFYTPQEGEIRLKGKDITRVATHHIAKLGIARQEIEEKIIDLLEIETIRKKVVGTLPYGLQKRVELARALAMQPEVLLLDEPMAGMNLEETEDMARFIINVNQMWRVSIILVEHDMGVVMDISDRVCVLEFGQKIAQGSPQEIQENPQVIRAYLGEDEKAYSRL